MALQARSSSGLPETVYDATMLALGEIDKKLPRNQIVDRVLQWENEVLEYLERERHPASKKSWMLQLEAIRLYKSSRNIQ